MVPGGGASSFNEGLDPIWPKLSGCSDNVKKKVEQVLTFAAAGGIVAS